MEQHQGAAFPHLAVGEFQAIMARKSMHGRVSHAHSAQPNHGTRIGVNQNCAALLEWFARVGELTCIQIHGAVMSERQDSLATDRKGISYRTLAPPSLAPACLQAGMPYR